MTGITRFIPGDRRSSFRSGTSMPDRALGTALFADVSGFSMLTRQLLDQLGEKGAEAVPQYINPLYDAIVTELHRYGGSVIGFAGDAITCWLDGDTGERAIACAEAMLVAMEQVTNITLPDGSNYQLGLKLSLASGPARRFMVGDPDIVMMDALAGATVATMAEGEHHAQPGDIVLSPTTYAQMSDRVVIREWRDGYAILDHMIDPPAAIEEDSAELPPIDDAIADTWTLAPVRERLQGGGFLAELRFCTALFLRFDGIDYDEDDEAGDKLNRFVTWVQRVGNRNGGHIIQLTLGDKGSYIYTVFGAPRSYGNNSTRAATAALQLREAGEQFDFLTNVQVGLSQGRMWTGAYGAEARSTYGAMSDATNMAARLMMRAGSAEAIIDDSTVAELSERFALTSLDTMMAKGRATPLPIWRLESVKERVSELPTFSLPLLERETLLTDLTAMWSRATLGERQIGMVAGEAGVGKSHLVTTFTNSLASSNIRIAISTNDTNDPGIAYSTWRQLFASLLGLATRDAIKIETIQAALVNTKFADDVRLPLLGDLLGRPLPENATTDAFEPEVRRDTLTALVIEMIQAWAEEKPLLLIMDDVQWLDTISLALLEKVIQRSANWSMMLILAHRPVGEKFESLVATGSIDVTSISAETTRQIAQLLLDAPVSTLVADLIFGLTDGNPFFIESLIATMRLSNQIEQRNNRWHLSSRVRDILQAADYIERVDEQWQLVPDADVGSLRLGLPASIHDTVLTRLDQLEEASKLTLKVASVIGVQFRELLLQQAYPQTVSAELLHDKLDDLSNEALVASLMDDAHRFRHRSTQEVAYSTMLFSQRRELHRRVALALEQLETDAVDVIAQHAFDGELWELALRCYMTLGERAQQLFANHQSVSIFTRALVCIETLDDDTSKSLEGMVRLALGESLVHLGRYEEAHTQLIAALSLTEQEPDAHARVHRWIGRWHELQGQFDEALAWLEKGLVIGGQSVESAEMLAISGLIETRRGNYDNAHALCEQTLRMTESVEAPAFRGRALSLLAIIARLRSQPKEALQLAEESLETYRSINNRRGEALALNEIAVVNVEHGSWRIAFDAYNLARNIFVETGDVYNRVFTDNNLGNIVRDQGREDEALAYYESALTSLSQIGGSPYVNGAIQINFGAAYLRKGDYASASAEFEAANALFEEAGSRNFSSELNRYRAQLALATGDLSEAKRYADSSLSDARELSMRAEEGYALYVQGLINLEEGMMLSAETNLTNSITIFDEVEDPYGRARARLDLARLLRDNARLPEAKQFATEAAEQFELIDAEAARAEAVAIVAA